MSRYTREHRKCNLISILTDNITQANTQANTYNNTSLAL